MVTYAFYRDVFLGSRLEEDTFPGMIAQAERWVQKLERTYQVEPVGKDSRELAVCAVAETLDENLADRDVIQSTVGKVSIRYSEKKSLERKLYRSAAVFLKICRGVSA